MRRFLAIVISLIVMLSANAKSSDTIAIKSKSRYPVVGMWKHNYMATGFATNSPITKNTCDIKFQLSVAVRLWNIKGDWDILATYSQKSHWDAYKRSAPFRESAYNPALWAVWQTRDDLRLLFGIEHESNGLGNRNTRSVNIATVACLYEPFNHWKFGGRVWYGIFHGDGEKADQSYFNYRGVMQVWGTFHAFNERLQITALVNPTLTFTKYNVQVEASWRLAKRKDWLPSLFVQYCYGYGETMIDYNRRFTKIRVGISLINNGLNLY